MKGKEYRNKRRQDPTSRYDYDDDNNYLSQEYQVEGNKDHLEDFDSQQEDVASKAATSGETFQQELPGSMYFNNGTSNNNKSLRTTVDRQSSVPGMSFLDDLEQSVNSRAMEELMDYTFDGSTITSDIMSKKYRHAQNQQAVIDWGDMPDSQRRQAPQVLKESSSADPTIGTFQSSDNHDNSKRNNRASTICCGMGRVALALLCLIILVVVIAVILWLVLVQRGHASNSSTAALGSSGSGSPCCKGDLSGKDLLGKEICRGQTNGPDICCVVCDKSNPGSSSTHGTTSSPQQGSTTTSSPVTPSPTYIRTQVPSASPTVSLTAKPTPVPSVSPSLTPTVSSSLTSIGAPSSTAPTATPTLFNHGVSGRACCSNSQGSKWIAFLAFFSFFRNRKKQIWTLTMCLYF